MPHIITFKEVWRIMADEPEKEPQTQDEAMKALRLKLTQHTAAMDEMAAILGTHDAQIALLMKQGVMLTLALAALLFAIKRITKEIPGGSTAQ